MTAADAGVSNIVDKLASVKSLLIDEFMFLCRLCFTVSGDVHVLL